MLLSCRTDRNRRPAPVDPLPGGGPPCSGGRPPRARRGRPGCGTRMRTGWPRPGRAGRARARRDRRSGSASTLGPLRLTAAAIESDSCSSCSIESRAACWPPARALPGAARARVARAGPLHHAAAHRAGRAELEALELRRDRRGLVGQRGRRGLRGRAGARAGRRAVARVAVPAVSVAAVRLLRVGPGVLAGAESAAGAGGLAVSPRISASCDAFRARTSGVRMPSSSCRSASPKREASQRMM